MQKRKRRKGFKWLRQSLSLLSLSLFLSLSLSLSLSLFFFSRSITLRFFALAFQGGFCVLAQHTKAHVSAHRRLFSGLHIKEGKRVGCKLAASLTPSDAFCNVTRQIYGETFEICEFE